MITDAVSTMFNMVLLVIAGGLCVLFAAIFFYFVAAVIGSAVNRYKKNRDGWGE